MGPFPPNVHVEAWIAQDAILPYCSAVVTHGGYGTVSAALGHGVAMVLLPISADQPMNAARLTAAGVGITLPPDGREPHQIRDATCRILEQPCYRQRAMRLAREGADRPGLPHALDLLEGLARRTACQAR